MFPSIGLLSQVDCPFKDGCTRGTVCLFKHRKATSTGTRKKELAANASERLSEAESGVFVDIGSEEITLDDPKPSVAPATSVRETSTCEVARHIGHGSGNPKEPDATAAVTHHQTTSKEASSSVGHTLGVDKGKAVVAEQAAQIELIRKDAAADDNTPSPPRSKGNSVENWRTRTLNYDPDNPGYDSTTEREAVVPQLKAIVGDKIGYFRRQRTLEILFDHYRKIPEIVTALKESPSAAAMHAVESEKDVYDNSVAGTYHGKLLVCLKELKRKAQA